MNVTIAIKCKVPLSICDLFHDPVSCDYEINLIIMNYITIFVIFKIILLHNGNVIVSEQLNVKTRFMINKTINHIGVHYIFHVRIKLFLCIFKLSCLSRLSRRTGPQNPHRSGGSTRCLSNLFPFGLPTRAFNFRGRNVITFYSFQTGETQSKDKGKERA